MEIRSIQSKRYDKINDVLYIKFSSMANSYGDEKNGVVLFRDMFTGEVTGVTVFYPVRDREERKAQLHAMGLDVDITV